MLFDIKSDHANLLFPARISFDRRWGDVMLEVVDRHLSKYQSARALVVYTPSQEKLIKNLLEDNKISQFWFARCSICDEESLNEIDVLCARNNVSILFAFGGGSVIDVCKLVSSRRSVTLVVVPSALSSDCIASPISVLSTHRGRISLPSAMPNEIIIDPDLLVTAPERLYKAGVGDLLSNASALLELKEKRASGLPVNDFSILMSEVSLTKFVSSIDDVHSNPKQNSLELAKGLVLSGMAMGFSGDSSPCSGSEHLISHSLDALAIGNALHGEQVGLATVYVSQLRRFLGMEEIPAEIVRILKELCGFYHPVKFGISENNFIEAVTQSNKVRRGRLPFWSELELSPSDFSRVFSEAFDH